MADYYDVSIKIVSQKGHCEAGHKVGDEWLVTTADQKLPPGLCMFAWDSISPMLKVLMFGGSFPREPDADTARLACVDAENPVVFELKRIHPSNTTKSV
jgi:uncharacterized repeat protein (TIGR04076 family)